MVVYEFFGVCRNILWIFRCYEVVESEFFVICRYVEVL